MPATAVPPPTDLERFIEVLWRPGDVREVRIPEGRSVDSGYFDDPAVLVAAVQPLDGRNNAYITVNPVDPALLARSANRIKSARSTTSDAQVIQRRWLPIDIDPTRPSGISASEAEREAALEVTRQVWTYLNGLGWPEPMVALSGNGYWMFYPIDLPNDAPSTALVEGVLGHLAARFGGPGVSIDTTVSNASRIVALIGMLKVKGDATPDRPHRRSGLLRMPKEFVAVSPDQLAALTPPAPTTTVQPVHLPAVITVTGDRMPEGWVGKLLDAAGVGYRPTTRKGTTWYRLNQCPFHPDDDQGGDCGVGEDADGKGLGHCFHNRGAGRTWQDFKGALGLAMDVVRPFPGTQAPQPPRVVGEGIDAADLLELDLPPIRWIVPDLIPEGTTILASPPKVGKSCLVYEIVVEAALGGRLLDRKVERGSALYLALEDGKRRGQTRLRAALAGREMPRGFLEVRWDSRLIGQGLEEDMVAWLDAHPDAVLVAIDTLQKVRGQTSGKRGAYEVDVEDLGRLQALFRDRRVALLIVHHARKDSSDDFLASVSGTYGITGSADTIIAIKRKRTEAFGLIQVTGRDVADAEIPVKFDGLIWSSAPRSLTESSFERQEILAVIESDGPIFPAAIADQVGLSRQSVQNMVTALVDNGVVARTTSGYVLTVTGVTVRTGVGVSDVSGPSSSKHIPGVSSDSDIRDTGDTRARARGISVECSDYTAHQFDHRQTASGWYCPICHPEDAA
jgi:hypothetical protein